MRFLALLVLYVGALVSATVSAFTQSAGALIIGLLLLGLWVYAVASRPKYKPRHLRIEPMTKTFEPTYETLLITKRIEDGDATAIKDLWEHVFPEVPFDPTRRLDDVAKDIAEAFEAYNTRRAAEEAEKVAKARADVTAESIEMITKSIGIITDILSSQNKRR